MERQEVMLPVLAELRTIRTRFVSIDRRLDRLRVKGVRACATAGAVTGGVIATGLALIRARLGV